jgi:hypothetical protein
MNFVMPEFDVNVFVINHLLNLAKALLMQF